MAVVQAHLTSGLGQFQQAEKVWISRSGNSKIEFLLNQDKVIATLFQKKDEGGFVPKYIVQEHNITVEGYNTAQLLRGYRQVIYGMNDLTLEQKKSVIESIPSRNIEIIDSITSGRLNILAPP